MELMYILCYRNLECNAMNRHEVRNHYRNHARCHLRMYRDSNKTERRLSFCETLLEVCERIPQ